VPTPPPVRATLTKAPLLCLAILAAAVAVADAAGGGRAGQLDVRFGNRGVARLAPGTRLFGAAVQGDGKVVVAGEWGAGAHTRLLLARFTAAGRLDRAFGQGGVVHGPAVRTPVGTGSLGRAVAIQPDGKIVVVGKATDRTGTAREGILIERYEPDGRLDRSFGSRGVVTVLTGAFGDGYAVAITPADQIIAAGSADAQGSGGVTPRVAVVRLTSTGRLDRGFRGHGLDVLDLGPYSYALAVGLAGGGRIVIAGSQAPGLQVTNALIARLSASGALDRSFASGGVYAHQYARGAAFSAFTALSVERGGSIVAAGSATSGQSAADALVVRFTASGRPRGATYATSATNYTAVGTSVPGATAVTVARGAIIAAGERVNGPLANLAVWAFTPGGRPARGFGSHGVAVLALKSGENSEAAAIAPAPGGKVVVAGDENPPLRTPYTGLLARFDLG
jgi:uncharacterized delta-60 repeat protein